MSSPSILELIALMKSVRQSALRAKDAVGHCVAHTVVLEARREEREAYVRARVLDEFSDADLAAIADGLHLTCAPGEGQSGAAAGAPHRN